MKNAKKFLKVMLILLMYLLVLLILSSCGNDYESSTEKKSEYPKYSLYTKYHIPDSVKLEYRTWITETVRAASQNMTGGDYERPQRLIRQVEHTAFEIFKEKTIILRIIHSDVYWDYDEIPIEIMTDEHHYIYDSLMITQFKI